MDGTPVEGGYGIRAAILELDGGGYACTDGRRVPYWPMDGCTAFDHPMDAEGLATGVVLYDQVAGERLWVAYMDRPMADKRVRGRVLMHLGRALQARDWEVVQREVRAGLMGAVRGGTEWELLYDHLEAMAPHRDPIRRERIAWLGVRT